MSELTGRALGNYRIGPLLGSGGMSQVYRAEHIHLGRAAAIKVMHPRLSTNAEFQRRFLEEARHASKLTHDNIIDIYEFGEHNGNYFLVLELAEDGSLRGLMQRHKRRRAEWVGWGVDLVRQAARGLAYAHREGMVHCDIKPDNLLLCRQNGGYVLKVTDFGLARLAESGAFTDTGIMLGTPAYMSPEQCEGLDLDRRSDIYSLGVVLYEVATGLLPFDVNTLAEAFEKHVNTAPPAPRAVRSDLPAELERIILRALAKKPDDRFPTMEALDEALAGIAALLPRPTPVPSLDPPTEPEDGPDTLVPDDPRTTTGSKGVRTPEGPRERIWIELEHQELSLTPGRTAVLGVTLRNLGRTVDAFQLLVQGVPKSWVQLPPQAHLLPNAQAVVPLAITAPREPTSRAGTYEATVTAQSRDNPSDNRSVSARWEVLPYDTYQIALNPQLVRGRTGVQFKLLVRNDGNESAAYRVQSEDDEDALRFDPDSTEITVDPGQETTVVVKAEAPRRWLGSARTRTVELRTEPMKKGIAPQIATGQFIHLAVIPKWLPPLLLLVLLAIGYAFWAVLNREPAILSLSTDPEAPTANQPFTLHWRVQNAAAVEFAGMPPNTRDIAEGSYTFHEGFPASRTLRFIARKRRKSVTQDIRINITPPQPVVELWSVEPMQSQQHQEGDPLTITQGEEVSIRWRVRDAESVTLTPWGDVDSENERIDRPQQTRTYTLTATSGGRPVIMSREVVVKLPDPPGIPQFTVTPSSMVPGQTQTVTLRWETSGARDVIIDPDVGNVPPSGTRRVSAPSSTTAYTLLATNAGGTTRRSTTLVVRPQRDGETGEPRTGEPRTGESSIVLLEIPVGQSADLDTGSLTADAAADLRFRRQPVIRELGQFRWLVEPRNGAALAIAGRTALGANGCAAARFSTASIPHERLRNGGTWVCIRTNEGRISEFRIIEMRQDILRIEFVRPS